MPIYLGGKSNNSLQKSKMSPGTHMFLRFNMFPHKQASYFFCVPWAMMKIMFQMYSQNMKICYIERYILIVVAWYSRTTFPLVRF
jgi:hypothetical protein